MAEYINKQALITEIQSAVSMVLQTAPYEKVWFDRFVDRQNEIMAIIERQPAAEVEVVRRGEWLLKHMGHGHYWECSECHTNPCIYVTENTKFCPNCGARMDGGNKNEQD